MGSGLFFRDSRIGHVSHDRPRAGWAHVAISRRSKSDHYRCPFCFPLWQEVGNMPSGVISSRKLREKGNGADSWAWTREIGVASIFVLLWRASACWQSLKCTSHTILRVPANRRFLGRRDPRGWCGESSTTVRIWSLKTRVSF